MRGSTVIGSRRRSSGGGGGGGTQNALFGSDFERPPATATSPWLNAQRPQAANYGQADTAHATFGDFLVETANPWRGSYSAILALPGNAGTLSSPYERVNVQVGSSNAGTIPTYPNTVGLDQYYTIAFTYSAGAPLTLAANTFIWQSWAGSIPPVVGVRAMSDHLTVMINAGKYDSTKNPQFEWQSDADDTVAPLPKIPAIYLRPPSLGALEPYPTWHEGIFRIKYMDSAGVAAGNTGIVQTWYRKKGAASFGSMVTDSTTFGLNFATMVTDAAGAFSSGFTFHQIVGPMAYRRVQNGHADKFYFDGCFAWNSLADAMAYMG